MKERSGSLIYQKRLAEETKVEKNNGESIKTREKESTITQEKVKEEGGKQPERERYLRFKNLDIGNCNDGTCIAL